MIIQRDPVNGRILTGPHCDWKERFWSKVNKNGPIPQHRPELGQCWLWVGNVNDRGYGLFPVRSPNYKRIFRAHRLGFFLGTGQWPDPELEVCHKCDLGICVRYDHLFEGTHLENMLDASAKGRMNVASKGKKGEKNNHAKLTWPIVNDIREEKRLKNTPDREIAEKRGISRRQVANILANRQWVVPLPAASTIPAATEHRFQ